MSDTIQDILLRLSLLSDDVSKDAYDVITSLRQRVEELEALLLDYQEGVKSKEWANIVKDAERYRAIVADRGGDFEFRVWVGGEDGDWIYPMTKDGTDRAIDAACASDAGEDG